MNIGVLTATLGIDATGLSAGTAAMQQFEATTTASMQRMAQKFRTFGYLASAVITLPMVAAGKSAMKSAMDFEFTLKKMVGLAGIAKESLGQISKEIKGLASETGVDPQKVLESYYFVASSGIKKAADVLKITEMAAKGAASGLGEVDDIAKLLTSSMIAYAAKGLNVATMMDVLTATIREGKAEPAAMVTAFGSILPIAVQLGLSIQDVGGSLATMTLITTQTAQSATYLRNVLMKLLHPTPEVTKALEHMKIPIEQIHKLLKSPNGFVKTMELLNVTTEKYSVTMDAIFPEMRSLLGALNYTGEGFKRLERITEAVNKATGDFQKHYVEMSTTMKMKWNKALAAGKNAMTDLGTSIAMGVIPILESLVQKLNNVTKWFNSLSDAQKQNKLHWLAFIAILGPASMLISVVIYTITGLISAIKGVWTALKWLWVMINTNPVMLLINLVLALGVALLLLRKRVKDVTDEQTALNKIWDEANTIREDSKSIEDRMLLISLLDTGQREKLLNDINERIALEKDYNIRLLTEKKEGVKDDLFILNQKKIINEAYRKIDAVMANPSMSSDTKNIWSSKYAEDIFAAQNAVKKYKEEVTDATDRQLASIPLIIDLYTAYGETVSKLLTKEEKEKIAKEKLSLAAEARAKEIQDIIQGIKDELKYTDDLAKLMKFLGIEYDAVNKKAEILLSGMEALTKKGFGLQSKEIKDQIKLYQDLRKSITEIPISKAITSNIAIPHLGDKLAPAPKMSLPLTFYKDFEKELDLIALKNKVLGLSFNTAREQLSFFKQTLNVMWDAGMKPGMPLMDMMIEKIKQLSMQQEAIDRLEEAFTNLFMIGKEGFQDFGQYIKDWVLSVLQSFQRLLAEIAAKKITEKLMQVFTKSKTSEDDAGGAAIEVAGTIAKTVALAASIPVTTAATVAATNLAIASAAAAAAWVPFPATIAAVAGNITGVVAAMGAGSAAAAAISAVPGMIEGGVVPPGYPNDSYLARLTSGETITPPGKLGGMAMRAQKVHVTVSGNISGKDLALVMRRATTMN